MSFREALQPPAWIEIIRQKPPHFHLTGVLSGSKQLPSCAVGSQGHGPPWWWHHPLTVFLPTVSIFPGLPSDHFSLGVGQAHQHSRGINEGLGKVDLFVGGTRVWTGTGLPSLSSKPSIHRHTPPYLHISMESCMMHADWCSGLGTLTVLSPHFHLCRKGA